MTTQGPLAPEDLLRLVPFFRDLDRVALARLVGALVELTLPAGSVLLTEGGAADALFLVERGHVTLTVASQDGDVQVAELDGPGYFGELGLLLQRRTATARAATDVRLWKLPQEGFEQVVRERPDVALVIARSLGELLDRRQRQLIGAPLAEAESRLPAAVGAGVPGRGRLFRAAGAVAALGLPYALWGWPPPDGLSVEAWRVLLVLLGASVAWLAEPVPDFVVAIGLVTAWGALGLAPLDVSFSGFATSAWVLALGALVLAAAMAASGLLFRCALLMLRAFPPTHTGQVVALILSGAVVTPLVPLSVARVAAIARVTRELAYAFAYRARGPGAAGLAFAGFIGYWYFSNIFLTGFATNFYVLELLPPAERARFDWITWLAAAAPAGLVSLVGGLVAVLWLFPPELRGRVATEALERQLRVLGPPARAEGVTALALVVLIGGLVLQRQLGLDPAWVALASLVIVMSGVLQRAQFRAAVDWGFLMLFGLLLGSAAVLQQAGVDRWLARAASGGAALAPEAAVLALALTVTASRVVFPSRIAILLLGLAFVPAAPEFGVSSWVAGFVVLLAANVWVLPYQGIEYLVLREATGEEAFTDRQGMAIGAALTGIRFAAIAASIPVWRAMGLLG